MDEKKRKNNNIPFVSGSYVGCSMLIYQRRLLRIRCFAVQFRWTGTIRVSRDWCSRRTHAVIRVHQASTIDWFEPFFSAQCIAELTASQPNKKMVKDIIYDVVVYLWCISSVIWSLSRAFLLSLAMTFLNAFIVESKFKKPEPERNFWMGKMSTKQNYIEYKQITHQWSPRELNFRSMKLRRSNESRRRWKEKKKE